MRSRALRVQGSTRGNGGTGGRVGTTVGAIEIVGNGRSVGGAIVGSGAAVTPLVRSGAVDAGGADAGAADAAGALSGAPLADGLVVASGAG